MPDPAPHIGTLREQPLHAALKQWYAAPGDRIEVPIDGFVIDVVRGDVLVEVQTSGFSSIKRKVVALLDLGHQLRIVHPIARDKWIVKIDGDGQVLSRRRSPRHGELADLAGELVSFPDLLFDPLLEVEVLITLEEELRRHTPGKAWRRRGWIVVERRLIDVVDSRLLRNPGDLRALLPDALPDPFTTAELAAGLRRPRRTAQQLAYCLRRCGAIVAVGKRGNAVEYRTI